MKFLNCNLFAVLFACLTAASAARASDLKLWYTSPGTYNLTQGLLIGNGRMGAIVPGKVAAENIVLNESSLWSGTANLSGGYATGPAGSFGSYQLFGNLLLNLPGHTNYTGYKRVLDIGTGVATVDYTNNGVAYHRELFCSAPDQVLVIQLTASSGGAYTGSIQLTDGHSSSTVSVTGGLMFSGALANGELYEAQLQVLNSGGTLVNSGGVIQFTNCDSLTLLVALGTDYVMDYSRNYHGANPHATVVPQVQAGLAKSFGVLETAHTNDFCALFDRVTIDLGPAPASRTNLPTDQRITAGSGKGDDPGLEELMFQYGRYLMISSSRTGCPMNLQGLWNDSNSPAWGSDYHTDINIEMMYWQAEVANLAECAHPLNDFIQSQVPAWRYVTTNASTSINNGGYGYGFGGSRGWTVRTSHNINGGLGWEWIEAGNAWYCMHLWEHFAFSGDTNYLLNAAYPLLKETCQFWQDHLQPLGPNGQLVVTNGWSPEHGGRENGVSFDQELVWDVFNNYIQASTILSIDADYRATVAALQAKLLVPGIGPWGELREWLYTADSPTDDHRHTMHLVGLYPGCQFTPTQTPVLAAAARVGLLARGDTGDSAFEWAHAWRIALFARLHDAVNAHHKLALYSGTLEPNLVAYYSGSIAQWDGSCGVTAGICEMLLQSHENELNLLPALPNAWPAGSVKGLRGRGGFTVDLSWTNAAAGAIISASLNGLCRVRTPNPVTVTKTGVPVAVTHPGPGLTEWPANDGDTFALQWVQPPFPAAEPKPAQFAANINLGTRLSWTAGWTNYQHDLYFGTSSNAVLNATVASPEYQGRLSVTNFTLPVLLTNTTYFWRVDEVAGTNVGTGTLWNFTTAGSFQATNPVPALGQTKVAVSTPLSWTPGLSPNPNCLHDLYLGTSSNAVARATTNSPEYRGRVAPASFSPAASLQTNMTYYWRVDEVVGTAVSPGPVWYFTTARDYLHSALSFYYTLDSRDILNGTNLCDRSGSPPNNGTLNPSTSLPSVTTGRVGEALTFNGSSQYAAAPAPNVATANATFLCWLNRNGAQTSYAGLMFCRGATTVAGLDFYGGNNTLGYHWNNESGTYNYNSGLMPPSGQWAFVALVVTPTNATFYLGTTNGALTAASRNYTHVLQSFDGPIRLGSDSSQPRLFNGSMDEAYFWTRSLTSAEVGLLFTNGLKSVSLDGAAVPQSGTFTWTGAANTYWTNAGNWCANATPAATDIAIFDFSSFKNLSTDLGQACVVAGVNINGPLFNAGIAAAGGYPLTLGSAGFVLSNTPATLSLAAPVVLATNQTWSILDGGTLLASGSITNNGMTLTLSNNNLATFNGALRGAGGLTHAGAGTLTLATVNPFTGTLNLMQGTVNVTAGTSSGNASAIGNGANTILLGRGAALAFTSGGRTCGYHSGNVTNCGGTLLFNTSDNSFASGHALVFDQAPGLITGTGQLRMRDAGAQYIVTPAASGSRVEVANFTLTFQISGGYPFNVARGTAVSDLTIASPITGHAGGEGLTKTGAGILSLEGANTYTGPTFVNNGTLLVNGTLGAGAVIVGNTAALGGTGVIGGSVTVNSGATLRVNPAPAIGKLSIGGGLTLNGGSSTALSLSKDAGVAGSDVVQVGGGVTFAGVLVVTNIGTNVLAAGDSFTLFRAASYAGAFDSLLLPALPGGLSWNTSALASSGTLSVITNNSPAPSFLVNLPGPVQIFEGGTAVLSPVIAGQGVLNYQWERDGSPLVGATNATLTLTTVSAADSGRSFRLTVSNPWGTNTSADAVLKVVVLTSPAFPGPAAGPARATYGDGVYTLSNNLLSMSWRLTNGSLAPMTFINNLSTQTWSQAGAELFRLGHSTLGNARKVAIRLGNSTVETLVSFDGTTWITLQTFARSSFPGDPAFVQLGKMDLSGTNTDYSTPGSLGECGLDELLLQDGGGATLLQDNFSVLSTNWTAFKSTAAGTAVFASNNWLVVTAPANCAAYVRQALPAGVAFASCVIDKRTDQGQSWSPSLCLRWANGTFLLVGYRAVSGTFNVISSPAGEQILTPAASTALNLAASACALLNGPRLQLSGLAPRSARLGDQLPGQEITATFQDPASGIQVDWRAVLRDGANYFRQFLTIHGTNAADSLNSVQMLDFATRSAAPAQVGTATSGNPVTAGQTFFGGELPFARDTLTATQVNFSVPVTLPLAQDTAYDFSAVAGVFPAGQLRRGFLYYLERERAMHYRPLLHYNTWLDINRSQSEAAMLGVITNCETQLGQRLGTGLDSYALDDGWDNSSFGFWAIDPNDYARGFAPLAGTAAATGTHLGIWLSPLGGYAPTQAGRIQAAVNAGIIPANASSLDLSLPTYYDWWGNECRGFITNSQMNYFKWDNAGSGVTPHFMALVRSAAELRSVLPTLFINVTVGTWPSPFWLNHVDSTWRGGYDTGFQGAGDTSERWLNYRDATTYANVAQVGPLYPLNSIMVHGLIYATSTVSSASSILAAQPDLRHQARSFFGAGANLQELYITPSALNSNQWSQLAEAIAWARANANVLADTHWVGGNPGAAQVYGWAAWTPQKGVLTLRNPSAQNNSITLEAGGLFELPAGAPTNYNLTAAYVDQRPSLTRLQAGQPVTLTLAPFEVLVFDALPDVPVSNFTLSYYAGANGTLSGATPQVVGYGGGGTPVTAIANPGCVFTGWSDGLTVNPRTDVWVTSPLSVTANFAVLAPPVIEPPRREAGDFAFSFRGLAGRPFVVLETSNLALPLASWTINTTGRFGADGSAVFTNAISAGPARFYRVQTQ